MKKVVFFILFFSYAERLLCVDSSLTTMAEAIARLPETVIPDNNDDTYPDFSEYYRKSRPSWWERWWEYVKPSKSSDNLFSFPRIKELFEVVTDQRELNGYYGKHVITLPVKAGDKLVVFGDLQGAVHSLMRDLQELEKLSIINNNLKVTEGYFIIFNSNVIGRTPYNEEMLTILLSLMAANPQRVIYIRGEYEDEGYGGDSIGGQFEMLSETYGQKSDFLKQLFKRFLNTLPLAVYVNYNQGTDILRISGYGREYGVINEQLMDGYFKKSSNKEHLFKLDSKRASNEQKNNAHVRIIIRSLDGIDDFIFPEGLYQLEPYRDSVSWTVFSSPTRIHHKISHFYKDAFAIIAFGNALNEAIVTLYNRDIRTDEPFAQKRRYLLYSGDELLPGATLAAAKTNFFNVGCTLDLTKMAAPTGKAVRSGINLCLKEYNKKNDTPQEMRVFMFDDGYNPVVARENMEYLMHEEKIDTFLLPVGSPTLYASLDLLKTGSIIALFPITGAQEFRSPHLPGIINLWPSYRDEIYALMPYLLKGRSARKFAFFYQDDVYGQSALQAAREILTEQGIKAWKEISYNRNTTDFKYAVEEIKKYQPDAIGLFSAAGATQELFRQIEIDSLVGVQMFGTSFLANDAFKRALEDLGLQCIFARSVPNVRTSNLSIAQEYRKALEKYNYPESSFSFEAYIGTSLLFEALKNIAEPIDHQKLRLFFESLKNYPFKGLSLNFNPSTRSLLHDVWLDTGSLQWIKVPAPEATYRTQMLETKKEAL